LDNVVQAPVKVFHYRAQVVAVELLALELAESFEEVLQAAAVLKPRHTPPVDALKYTFYVTVLYELIGYLVH
jgi:hypothetical protein